MESKRATIVNRIMAKTGTSKQTLKKSVGKLTKAGQHPRLGDFCIATSLKGKPCCEPKGEFGVPYCKQHKKTGDSSLRVANHPLAGKILVAARDLPRGYSIPLWGKLKRKKDVSNKALEWAFDLSNGWFIDPIPCKGSLVQFCPCAGPNEVAVIQGASVPPLRGDTYGSWFFFLREDVKKNFQITLQYGDDSKGSDEFFEERGIKRLDVGTKSHPAKRRNSAP